MRSKLLRLTKDELLVYVRKVSETISDGGFNVLWKVYSNSPESAINNMQMLSELKKEYDKYEEE